MVTAGVNSRGRFGRGLSHKAGRRPWWSRKAVQGQGGRLVRQPPAKLAPGVNSRRDHRAPQASKGAASRPDTLLCWVKSPPPFGEAPLEGGAAQGLTAEVCRSSDAAPQAIYSDLQRKTRHAWGPEGTRRA